MEIATSIPKGSSRLLQYEFPSVGMTLKVAVTQGNLAVLGSFSVQNPNELTQDFSVMSNGNDIDYFISPELLRQSTTDDDDDDHRRHKKRQTSMPTNATNANVYLSIVGLNDNNTFALNTTFGDTTESIPTTASGKRVYLTDICSMFFNRYQCSGLNDNYDGCFALFPALYIGGTCL